MNNILLGAFALIAIPSTCLLAEDGSQQRQSLDISEIAITLRKAADWQLANPTGNSVTTDWVSAPLYDGLLRLAQATQDPKYLAAVIRFGEQSGWQPSFRIYHADDIAVCHAWLDIYGLDKRRTERLAPTKQRLDAILDSPRTEPLDFRTPNKFPGVEVTDRWSWCDALYMAPPTFSRLYQATGNEAYLAEMDRQFQYTYDHLWSKEDHLFYRDATYFDRKTRPGGKRTFWSRGNGWVYGGLCLMLETLPKDCPKRAFYEGLYLEMTESLLAAQQSDGLWRPSLLDPEQVTIGETSGSGFFLFGLSWGARNGLLKGDRVWSAIAKAWKGLSAHVGKDGYVGYVQRIGASPESVTVTSRQDYGTGALLLGGSELLKALGANAAQRGLADMLEEAERLAELRTPQAYARLVPLRKDDLAWENDKVAYRIYGPALKAGPEGSGIDIWCKRVPYPIINKWYREDLVGKKSYHIDRGEGLDGYQVGVSRGCGGLGLWQEGKLVLSSTYIEPSIIASAPDLASFRIVYEYPQRDGTVILETKRISLRMGEQLNEIEATFSTKDRKPLQGLEVAVGLSEQNSDARFVLDEAQGVMSLWDKMDGAALGLGVALVKGTNSKMLKLADTKGRNEAICILRTDDKGVVRYKSGFAWAKHGDIQSPEQWIQYLLSQTAVVFQQPRIIQ